jgi:hypothetical protein
MFPHCERYEGPERSRVTNHEGRMTEPVAVTRLPRDPPGEPEGLSWTVALNLVPAEKCGDSGSMDGKPFR